MVRILFENPLRNVEGKTILQVCVHYPHAGECVTALHVIISFFFFFSEMLFYRMFGIDLFIVAERSNDITHFKLLPSLEAKISDICECKRQ